ncbi:group III truncated hemoglobin [Adhaeribacter swui]|uniref:Group III truncated hemoglobin n=1 Tax=Adhaeribacter swui TaxID=2086471 RepID=A0A7G7G8Z2_9BACT|nr:group III truncated hemoglobin [Adhaeribacter swui]QNF33626.1 group III truncated hemoglobin [Adhaeribacter swui]
MQKALVDITTEDDIKTLVDRFYEKVNQDAMLSPIFNDFAKVDWEKHLPKMYQFWSSILLGTFTYAGQPFPKHAFLPVNPTHFAQWLHLFYQTVNENFSGPIADEAKIRAANIARIFSNKIEIIQGRQPAIPTVKSQED